MVAKSRLVLNTLVAQANHDQGADQAALIKALLPLGSTNFELRYEYLHFTVAELTALNQLRLTYRLTYFLSVPDELFKDGHLTTKLVGYAAQAQALGASYLKFNLGDFQVANAGELAALPRLVPANLQLNIENDQTLKNARLATLLTFFDQVQAQGANVGFVNDLGNWVYTNQDERAVTKALLPYTRYVHLKGYQKDGRQVQTTSFTSSQLAWQKLLPNFAPNIPVALEYPAPTARLKKDLMTLLNF